MSQEWPQVTQTSNTESRKFPFLLSRELVLDASNCRAQGRANKKKKCESLGRSAHSVPQASVLPSLPWDADPVSPG